MPSNFVEGDACGLDGALFALLSCREFLTRRAGGTFNICQIFDSVVVLIALRMFDYISAFKLTQGMIKVQLPGRLS